VSAPFLSIFLKAGKLVSEANRQALDKTCSRKAERSFIS